MERIAGAIVLLLLVSGLPGCSAPAGRLVPPANVVLVVIDTLRADHLPFYGYGRDTAPRMTKLFADEGIVFERAYSQASWTPPSIAALMTGLRPARFAPADVRQWRIPKTLPTLAERLSGSGYRTGGFQGNLLLSRDFARGFQRYFMTGHGWDSIAKHADEVLTPAVAWIEQHSADRKPFFLYAHFVDPHDPYLPPRSPGERPYFDPEYTGPITGEEIHGLNEGRLSLSSNPSRDIHHLRALYDEEIRYVDNAVAQLVSAAERAPNNRPTLIVLASDHGEEIQDRGGWAHGRTIYEEIVHVPLAFRLTGVARGGRRIETPVSLLDVAPTILAAAGVESAPLDGIDLLPVLLGAKREPERRPIHLRSWQRGPLRAGLIEGRMKTMIFNRGEPFLPDPGLEAHLAVEDGRRLLRAATFDLEEDPEEKKALPPDPDHIEAILARELPLFDGVRVLLRDVDSGTQVRGRLRWGKRPRRILPVLLDEGDRVIRSGRSIEFEFRSETHSKGFIVQGDIVALEAVEIETASDGSRTALELGRGSVTLPARRRALTRSEFPPWNGERSLRVWFLRDAPPESTTAPALDADTVRRLKALGYL